MPRPLVILPDPPAPPTAIGLIAGAGRLPIIVAEGLREIGHRIHGIGLANMYEAELPNLCDSFHEVGLFRVGGWGRALARRNVRHAIMVGKVDKAKLMHDPLRMVRNVPDVPTLLAWHRKLRHDRRSYAVLGAIADELERSGVQLLDSTTSIPNELADAGVMTSRQPTTGQQADIDFVWPQLVDLLRLDIGQAVAVRERDIIAVEAVEGTDRMIERAGALCKAKGWTLCKGARCGHDRRSDVPTIGVTTIERMHDAGAGCLALAAGDVIMIDKEDVIAEADRRGIAIVGVPVGAA
ncbi:MAG: UDP-2,3-diacylglucosamine diphosphatase LpxI [Phycisphaerales bacterium]